MQAGYWKLGKWKKIPVFFHWTIFLWLPWYWWTHKNVVDTALTFVAFVALLCIHELGHAIAARSSRVPVYAIRLYLLHGQCEHEEPYYEAEDVFIAWGGVLAQLVVLAVALAALYLSRLLAPYLEYFLAPLFSVFINTNIVIAVINLIPVAPLDGHKAWRAIPLLRAKLFSWARRSLNNLANALNFKKRRATAKDSQRAAAELLDRLRKK